MIKFPGEKQDRKIQIIVGLFIILLAGMGINKIWGQQHDVQLVNAQTPEVTPDVDEIRSTTDVQGDEKHGMGMGEQNKSEDTKQAEQQGEVVVYITGAVLKPGIVKLPAGSRLYEALEQAGLREDSASDFLNPAQVVQDGQKYYVPNQVQAAQWNQKDQQNMANFKTLMENSNSVEDNSSNGKKININTATAKELEELNGVGPALANAIVQYRGKKGNFKRIDELKNVPGIGDKKFEQMQDQIVI